MLGIIDASEKGAQSSSSLILNCEMFSSNKCHTTSNGNVVNSSSRREIISDKELVKRSGLLQLLQPGDYLMTNMVFLILDPLAPLGCEVVMPSFLWSKKSFSKDEL